MAILHYSWTLFREEEACREVTPKRNRERTVTTPSLTLFEVARFFGLRGLVTAFHCRGATFGLAANDPPKMRLRRENKAATSRRCPNTAPSKRMAWAIHTEAGSTDPRRVALDWSSKADCYAFIHPIDQ